MKKIFEKNRRKNQYKEQITRIIFAETKKIEYNKEEFQKVKREGRDL